VDARPLAVAARRLLFAAAVCAAHLPCQAVAAPSSLQLEDLTSPEIAEAIRSGKTTILVPIGGTEQNGDHIAVGKHNARARLLAERIAARLGNALVAPVVTYVPEGKIDPPTGHMGQAGTITIPEASFEALLESAARSFFKHGFTLVVYLGDHGGYAKSVALVAARLNKERARGHVLVPKPYYRPMEHAGVEDTSLALALTPELVREARGGTRALGERLAARIVEETVRVIRDTSRR